MGKVSFAKCLFGCMGGLKFFWDKINWMPDSEFFTFFMPKNDLIFRPKARIFWVGVGFLYFFCTKAKKFNLVPPPSGTRLDFYRNCNCDSTLTILVLGAGPRNGIPNGFFMGFACASRASHGVLFGSLWAGLSEYVCALGLYWAVFTHPSWPSRPRGW